MREAIHPDYENATITCACGNVVVTKSTAGDYTVDVCSNCHPFYTGKQKLVDSAGMVEKFKKRYEGKKQAKTKQEKKEAQPAADKEVKKNLDSLKIEESEEKKEEKS